MHQESANPYRITQRACIHHLVEAAVARWPDAVAVIDGPRRLTYRALDTQSDQVAAHLQTLGIGAESIFGVYLERSAEMIVALLGVLKAGGAYLPIDPVYPAERIRFMLEDARARLVLTQESLSGRLAGISDNNLLIENLLANPVRNPLPRGKAGIGSLAYVIYTSGSTGQPKGVAVTQANAAWLFEAMEDHFDLDAEDVWTFFHSIAFDFSVWEIWGALVHGARLVVVPYLTSRSPEAFHDLLVREGVTILNQTPSAFRQLMAADQARPGTLQTLRHVILGGEALDARAVRPWFERHGHVLPRVVNMYGTTETTVFVTCRPLSNADDGLGFLIGKPLRDAQVLLLDERMEPVAAGAIGEMWIAGDGVSRGYLDRADLNAARFHPDLMRPNMRIYRTGDLARFLANGELEYLGRADQQIKLRGFRIELGEIEARLLSLDGVKDCAVIVREDTPGDQRLVAYVVPRSTGVFDAAVAQAALKQSLPPYMVPAELIPLAELPLTANGKLDRGALPKPASVELVDPLSNGTLEDKVAAVWQRVLHSEQVGRDENFFDLGGHSLLLVQVQSELKRALGVDLPITALFQNSTIRSLARHLHRHPSGGVAAPPTVRAARQRAAFAAARQKRVSSR